MVPANLPPLKWCAAWPGQQTVLQNHGGRYQEKSYFSPLLSRLYGAEIFIIRQYVSPRKSGILRRYLRYSPSKIKERVGSIASYFGLTVYFDQLSEKLPLGIKQRLSLACALIHNPPILFLDEATSGVDVVTRKEFWCHLRALAKKASRFWLLLILWMKRNIVITSVYFIRAKL